MPHILKFVPRSRARNNMAVRILPGGILDFDTVEEAIAFQRAQGQLGPVTPAPAVKKPAVVPEVSPSLQREMRNLFESMGGGSNRAGGRGGQGGGRRAFEVSPERENEPVTVGQGATITRAIGGLSALCGGQEAARVVREGGVTSGEILAKMGLTYGRASAVISEMTRVDVAGYNQDSNNPEKAAKAAAAREILFKVGNVACPTRSNPRWSR